MVTYGLRGHGNSDKPFEPERYKDSQAGGDEVQAVMDATGLKRPVLVGWSYGGRVMADYLKTHGTAKLSGLNDVDAGQKAYRSFFGPNLERLGMLCCPSLREIFLFPPSSGPRGVLAIPCMGGAGRWGALHEMAGKNSLTTGQARFPWAFDAGREA